jgi:hypothetical protein
MGLFTTIAAATVAIGSGIAKGAMASDGAATAARMAGRLNLERDTLEKESVARLEQNFLDAVSIQTDIYDKAIQASNVMGSTIVESAREGDQRGVSATAGKVATAQDASLSAMADNFANQQTQIDMARAAAGQMSAAQIAALQDDRAAAAGVQADALTQQADDMRGQATGAFMNAGVSALNAGITGFGGLGGGKNAMAKANQSLVDKGVYSTIADAQKALDGMGVFSNKQLKAIAEAGSIEGIIPEGKTETVTDVIAPIDFNTGNLEQDFSELSLEQMMALIEKRNKTN